MSLYLHYIFVRSGSFMNLFCNIEYVFLFYEIKTYYYYYYYYYYFTRTLFSFFFFVAIGGAGLGRGAGRRGLLKAKTYGEVEV